MKKRLTYNMIDFILTFLKVFVRITARNTFGTHRLCHITQDNNRNLTCVKKRDCTSIILALGFKDDFNSDMTQANCIHLDSNRKELLF